MNAANQLPNPLPKKADDDVIDLHQYWSIISRNKWGIVGLAAVVVAATIVVVSAMTPIYKATATLLIESEAANVVSIEEVYGIDSSQREYYQTQFEILNSRKLAGRVIKELGIRSHPEFDPDNPENTSMRGTLLSYVPLLPPPDEFSEDQKLQDVSANFRDRLNITPVRNTQLVNISFESADAALAPKVVNALGIAYIESHLEARLELTQKASGWLTDRLSSMREKLEVGERNLREFQESENLVDVSGVQTLTAKELDEITRRLVEARNAASVAKSQYDAVGGSIGGYGKHWEALPGVLRDGLAQNLKGDEAAAENFFDEVKRRYGPKHPKYISAASKFASSEVAYRARVQQIVEGFDEQYQQAQADLRDVERALAASKNEIQDINRKTYELSQLQREVKTSRQLYDMFFQRFQETAQTDFAAANARFVDSAVRPYFPVKPKKMLIVVLAGVLSVMAGVMLAFLRTALDNTIRVAEQMEEKLDQSVLGVLPLVKKLEAGANASNLYSAKNHTLFAEAIRSLRTSVVLAGLDKPHQVIVVTSSVPGEGKTTIASNLALALGQVEKVLLIDADMRRPSLAAEFDLPKATYGLAEIVAGTAELADCTQHLTGKNVDLITAGAVPPNPLDLLSSRRFESMLSVLRQKYDRIIVDSAPTQAVSDSLVLSTKADALIYVVKSDATPANIAANGLQRLIKVNAPIIGAVLNQFDAEAAAKYDGYAGGRYGYYGYGYASKSYS
jgi:succinoglycan biosynthesis transport protein ExoP